MFAGLFLRYEFTSSVTNNDISLDVLLLKDGIICRESFILHVIGHFKLKSN